MHPSLRQNLFFVKEHLGLFKAANNFDVLDPATGRPLLFCREPRLGWLTRLLRFTDFKRMTAFDLEISTPEGLDLIHVRREFSVFLSHVRVLDETKTSIGGFKQKFFSVGGKFDVLDAYDTPVCTLKGRWTGWEFHFIGKNGAILARVTKRWAGLGKELFTSADNYMLQIDDGVAEEDPVRMLILAAVLCIDMVLKE